MPDLLIFHDDLMRRHDNGAHHPERRERLEATEQRLRQANLPGVRWARPAPATPEDIARVHAEEHIAIIESFRGRRVSLDGDTGLSPGSVDAAYRSAGGAIDAARAVLTNVAPRAWVLGRPPGHHAERTHAMGFCIFNNVAIAAKWALEVAGLERVMIYDWDVHHGNGTQFSFYDDPRVLYVSTHQAPLFPGTGDWAQQGEGAGLGYNINLPMRAGCTDGDICSVFNNVIQPIAIDFEPELILISAGFDAHVDDPIGGFQWTSAGYAKLTELVCKLSDELTGGRLALVLEGGYDLRALAESSLASARVLTGAKAPSRGPAGPIGRETVQRAAEAFRWRWPTIALSGHSDQ